ncbi:pleckstrin homology domain-containing family G member 3-like isoform X2 [Syngnathoides biaculeatus]|uniref:pleckstrin homology domain-containing family G member 3-like isoform X2 n=1 Tax=Syngnathoides biaculeatus TaxID=300417 RepID=UPI002ADE13CF|nr:pleckstrin homology domain-containing family G member 3-like isoform X2 [Syngnathoides biaculeatus]
MRKGGGGDRSSRRDERRGPTSCGLSWPGRLSVVRVPAGAPVSPTSVMAPTYLDRVVSEIIETERTYVRDLRMIVEDYLAHIIDRADLSVRPEQVCFLFGNIEDIYEFNSELLQDLDLCQRDAVAVARCFVTKSEYFDIYTQYCTNYPNSVAALTDCSQDQSLAVFLRERQAASERPLPLGSYLLKPVQRILKYHLLLQEIAKHFDPEEEGYEVVEEAIVTMTSVAWYINDMKRKHEHAVRLQEVQSLLLNWKGPDLTTYGELVLEGAFKVHRAKHERTLFLLERVLLITKRRGEHYVYKEHISCSALMLIESAKDSLSFSVTHYKQPKQPHTLQAKSADEKKMWAQHIKRIILENHHDIIPQKAKDTIFNSRYPSGHRYCPEKLNKVPSCWSGQVPRRRSADVMERIELSAKGQPGVAAKETERSDEESDGESGLAEGEEPAGPQAAREQVSPCPPWDERPPTSETSTEEEAPASRLPRESRPLSEQAGSEGPTAARVSVLPASPESESKPGSSGESSEDEDSEKEEDGNGSILPPSVLDKAGAIAHFGSTKQGVPGQDDVWSPGASPRLPVGTRAHLAFSAKHAGDGDGLGPGRSSPLDSVASDLSQADRTLLSPRFDEESGVLPPRRDSTLSSRDQLLIGKIKMYYENAENQAGGLGLRRRESLTYIPAGLVKTSVTRLNSIPARSEPLPPALDSSSLLANSKVTMGSGDALDGQRSANPPTSGFSQSRLQRQPNAEDEDFRPSSEMVEVWQTMEKQLAGTPRLSERLPKEGAQSDPDFVSRETAAAWPLGHKANNVTQAARSTVPPGVLGAQLPQGARLGTQTVDEDASLTDERADSKVRRLARRYSQRIKSVTPLVNLPAKRPLDCVPEESPDGGPGPTLSAGPVDPEPPRSPEPAGLSPGHAGARSPARAICAPQSAEVFDWPDVQQLRSKYSEGSGRQAASRSSSVPEPTFDVGSRRRSSSDAAPRQPSATGTSGRLKSHKGLHRARSLDPRLALNVAAREAGERFPPQQLPVTGKLPAKPDEAVVDDDDDDAYVEIRSPTSREKISILAVMDRCRAYRDSEQYRQRSQLAKTQDGDDHIKSSGDHFQTSTATGQHSLVKNLREKFQKLNS